MIVGYAPGGGTDMTARVIAPYIEKYLGGTSRIAVINRTGAGGAIAFQAIASAVPDGSTIGFVNTPNLLTVPIERKVGFTWESFDLLGNVVDDPSNFSVHNDTPIRNIAELVAYARANPGAVTVGSTGIGSDDHIAMLMLERAAGIRMTHVPYRGSGEVHAAVASKSLMVAGINVGEALAYTKGGTPLRHLGQMSEQRVSIAPNLPTFKEQGYPIVMASLRGMAAPKGMPPAVLAQLVKAVEQAAADPAFREQQAKSFTPMRYMGPAAFKKELAETEIGFRKLWQELPWTETKA
ncbi:MAG: tripartite tricarboxylate transporter substrate binding protein [Comamonadaceae bacterium]|nr:MAG: tripartite tricarboxylate transporter substrate binding protein [Comamonadaceae bacterium]